MRLPKPDGGTRPINIFPAAVRLWMCAKSPRLRRWEADHSPDEIYGTSARIANRAAFLAAFEGEAACGERDFYAQAPLDLAKAFESVPHGAHWDAAKRRGYPLITVRLALQAYYMPRTISCGGICSRLVRATRGITAGSGTATAELRLLMLDLIDEPADTGVECKIYVDDVNLDCRMPNPAKGKRPKTRRQRLQFSALVRKHLNRIADRLANAVNNCIDFFDNTHNI